MSGVSQRHLAITAGEHERHKLPSVCVILCIKNLGDKRRHVRHKTLFAIGARCYCFNVGSRAFREPKQISISCGAFGVARLTSFHLIECSGGLLSESCQ